MKRIAVSLTCGWLVLCLACATAGADPLQVTQANSAFPQRAVLVSGPIGSLSPGHVHIIENGAPVPPVTVNQLSRGRAHDFGMVLVIDVYPSASAVQRAAATARGLAAYRPARGLLGIVEADSRPPIVLPLTRDANTISGALGKAPVISPRGLHVYNATLLGVEMLRNAKVAAASVIVLSDGVDRGEPGTLEQIRAAAAAGHVRIFSIGIVSQHFDAAPLSALAQPTGGQFVETGARGLSHIFTGLGAQLSSQYLIRYRSAQGRGQQVAASLHISGLPGAYDISYVAPTGITSVARHSTASSQSSFWRSTAAALLVSVVCALLIGTAMVALVGRRKTLRGRLAAFVPTDSMRESARTLVQRALGDQRRRRIATSGRLADLLLEMELARMAISPGQLAALTAAGAVLVGWLAVLVTSSPFPALVALAVPVGVLVLIRVLADRQRRQFDEQLPDNLQIIASAMRAGHTFGGAIAVVVEDSPEPSRREFRRALADEQLGIPLVDALDGVSARMHSKEFHHVALVARLQRDTGGNTAEVMDIVTDTIRERLDLRRTVRTLTAQGRLTGIVVSLLPVALLIAISLINPHYLRPLFDTTAGIVFLVLGVAMIITGALVIRRIIDIEA